MHPELHEHLTVIAEPTLSLVDLLISLAPLAFLYELVAAIVEHSPVPSVIEQRHLSVIRQIELIAMKKVITQLEGCGSRACINAEQPRIKLLSKLTDDVSFACCVPSFEADDGGNIRCLGRVLQLAQALLKLRHGFLICRFRKAFFKIEGFEHLRPYG